MNDKIDIILPWVDGSDPKWIEEKEKAQTGRGIMQKANSNVRYESWDNLCYIFRGIEKFMPWVNHVFLVTCGQVPAFLNTRHPKLKMVFHRDYIPKEYLPTFNSNVIELNYHRIEELSENFILFNDDTFPLIPIDEEYYFKDNIPCDEAVESPIVPVDIGDNSNYACFVRANNILLINKYFNKRDVQKKDWDKWYFEGYGELLGRNEGLNYWNNFVGFHDYHMPVPLKKSVLKHLWEIEPDLMESVSHHKFRDALDISHYVIRYWNMCEGNFIPQKSLGKLYSVTKNNYIDVMEDIRNRAYPMVCINEDCTESEFPIIRAAINQAFAEILPEKSSFEL